MKAFTMNRTSLIQRIARVTATGTLAALTACGLADAADRTYDLPSPTVDAPLSQAKGNQTLVVAGGCFWGVEAVFAHVKGVISATSGYSGGDASTASYDTVSTGRTGHAEAVKIVYDPSQVTVGQLLKVFFSVAHDPTLLNRQGPDHGTQYRSAVFYQGDEQKRVVEAYIDQLQHTTQHHTNSHGVHGFDAHRFEPRCAKPRGGRLSRGDTKPDRNVDASDRGRIQ